MFCTGIENSNPTIDGGRTRIDELESCAHYTRWSEDFDLVQELGIEYLRYGPPLHRAWIGAGRYDWEFGSVAPNLAKRLVITISAMRVFPPDTAKLVFAWARALTYPWSSKVEVLSSLPNIPELAELLGTLEVKNGDA